MKKLCLIVILMVLFPYILAHNTTSSSKPIEYHFVLPSADFNITYQNIRKWEGNYANHPLDKGGKTYGGITKRYNPDWEGWKYIKGNHKQNELIPEAEFWVMDFYSKIWIEEGFYKLQNQQLANAIFDLRVHTHKKKTIDLINRSLSLMGKPPINHKTKEWVAQLGRIDKAHLYNDVESQMSFTPFYEEEYQPDNVGVFLTHLKNIRNKYYYKIVSFDSSQSIFMKGWLKRSNATI